MPDLLTHTLFVTPLKSKFSKSFIFILLGTILPDIFGRMLGIVFPNSGFIAWLQIGIHTPVSLILIAYIISFFFEEKDRKTIFIYLIIGIYIHLLLDLFQKTTTFGYLWLFPFSFSYFNIPLIWPDETIFLIPLLILINLLIYLIIKKNKKIIPKKPN